MTEASILTTARNNPYKDGKILAIGVPLVTACMTLIGTNNDLSDPKSLLQLAMKLGYNALSVALCWIIVRQLIVFLDKKSSWERGKESRRLLQQIPLVFFGMNLGYFSTIILRTYLFEFWPIDWTEIWLTDYPLAILFFFLINFLYFYLWQQSHQPDATSTWPDKGEAISSKITVMKGRTTVLLDLEQINYAYREYEINYIMDTNGATYLWDDSLTALEGILPDFFRLNRQYLVSREAVQTYSVKDNRNLSVELKASDGRPLEVNKNRAAAFRRWLRQ